jgi:flagellar motor switch protein FliG
MAYNVGTTEFGSINQFAASSNVQKNQYISNTAPQYQSNIPQSFAPSSTASDFLKKIDQQLENSRNLYPS